MEMFRVMLLVLVLLFVGSEVHASSYSSSPSAPWLHKLPHNTITGTSLSGSIFLDTSEDYLSSLVAMGIFPMCVGLLGIIAGSVFCSVRFCCDSCGGKVARDSGYSKKERWLFKVLLLVNAVLIVVLVVLGIVGNAMFSPFLNDFASSVEEQAGPQQELTESIEPNLVSINANRTALKGYVLVLTDRAPNTEENAARVREYFAENDSWRLAVLGITYSFVLITVIIGCVSALLSLGVPSMVAACLSFGVISLLWINLGLHFPISVALADLCHDVSEVTIPQRLQARVEAIEAGEGGEKAVEKICYCAGFNNSQRSWDYAEELRVERLGWQQDILNNPDPLNETDIARYNEIQAEIELLEETQGHLRYIRDCAWQIPAIEPMEEGTCGDNLNGIVLIWATSFVLSILFITFAVLAIMGYKRFPNQELGLF